MKIYIHTILLKILGLNRSYIQQIRNQTVNNDIPEEPELTRFAPNII